MLDAKTGINIRFSCWYNPGAIKPQIWCKINGNAANKATNKVNLNGAKNGAVTSVAIMVAVLGKCATNGAATKP